jgi:hypothetical protein
MLRTALSISLAIALAGLAAPSAAQNVGVTAAVNQSVRGTPPQGQIRTISLGDHIIHDEHVETDTVGLVQILFLDGTTLTVGPDSQLVIDSFFYDPNAGTAEVAVTMTKGVLRFIGGLTSKTPDGAKITTQLGTIGIRGGITDIILNPPPGLPPHISMLFGNEVTLENAGELIGRLYDAGYSLVFNADGSVSVEKTPPEWSSGVQQALAGKPGSSGGSDNPPTNETVAESDVPGSNSENPIELNAPNDVLTGLIDPDDADDFFEEVTAFNELPENLVTPPDPPQPPKTFVGAGGGILNIKNYNVSDTLIMDRWIPAATTGSTATLASVTVDSTGMPVSGTIDITTWGGACHNCRVQFSIDANGTVATAVDSTGTYTLSDLTGSITGHSTVTLPAGVDYCECAFLHWGFWNIAGDVEFSDGTSAALTVTNGTWAVGDLTDSVELADLGVRELAGTHATYDGHAIGSVSTSTGPSYLAAGDLGLTWSFASRDGTVEISNFDGHDFSGAIADAGDYFTGNVTGDGTGTVRGGFVNNGAVPAAGVLGDFVLTDTNWNAAGIFVGERGPDMPD